MKKMLVITLVALAIPFLASADEYSHKIDLKKMSFEWKIDGGNLNVKLRAETEGWVGIGFNPTEKMKDADFILGYVKKDQVKVVDHFGNTKTQHEGDTTADGKENVTNVAGEESGGFTEVRFTIPLNSGDAKDTVIIADKETTVLLAHGAGRDSFNSKHVFKTALKVNLTTGEHKETK